MRVYRKLDLPLKREEDVKCKRCELGIFTHIKPEDRINDEKSQFKLSSSGL